jgi:two-component system sensor histidine kinase KdpD
MIERVNRLRAIAALTVSLAGLAACIELFRLARWANPTTVALGFLVLILVVATRFALWVAVVTAVVAMLGFNFFFLEPIGSLTIADPRNWIALFAFLTAAVIASQLSAAARARTRDAIESRNEVTRLYDLSRDVLLTGESGGTLNALARHVARRFELPRVAICLGGSGGWQVYQGGETDILVDLSQLDATLAGAGRMLEFDARERTYGGHRHLADPGRDKAVALVPLRLGMRTVGLLAAPADALAPGTADAIAGFVAIAVERLQFLSERKDAELLRQRADFSAALLASLSHDLRTPLTALQVAVTNLEDVELPAEQRHAQVRIARTDLERLTHLFRDILDMARVDSAAITPERDWVTAADVVDASLANLRPMLIDRTVHVEADDSTSAHVDPRLTSAAFSHLVENAAQYSAVDRPIDIRGWADGDGLHLSVRDRGPGLDVNELDHLFERFYRGRAAREHSIGTGMGLAITRGLLTAEQGRVWGENVEDGGGARFSLVVPAQTRRVEAEE